MKYVGVVVDDDSIPYLVFGPFDNEQSVHEWMDKAGHDTYYVLELREPED